MDKHFTHLHLHTDYSLLDGAITVEALVEFGKQNNFKALAMTDHGNIFGAVKFFKQAKKAGIKPILGMEAYFTQDASIKNAENKYHHLILLVENEQGYKNLCKLIAFSYQSGFYFKPRIDYAQLERYSEGLIATSACLGGHIPSLLMQNKEQEAEERIDWFLRVFGPERFYLEVQPDDANDQKILNQKLFAISKKKGVSCVAAGDCHYLTAEDREAHEVMLAIQTQHKITDPDRFTFGDCRVHVRTTEEMLKIFPGNEEAIWNSGKIADRCSFDFQTGKLFFPQFELPAEYTQDDYFAQLCKEGLKKLFDDERIDRTLEPLYYERLTIEMDLIIKVGFVGYFLVVSDFIRWARDHDIPVGPGRGSAAGSLVAWSLQITDIDPIKYNLLFERFLNPERVSMPDIDIDFCIEGRDAVIQ
nr:DNA polymerase III subunit alpha [Candidatus Dependentiae bacterium]